MGGALGKDLGDGGVEVVGMWMGVVEGLMDRWIDGWMEGVWSVVFGGDVVGGTCGLAGKLREVHGLLGLRVFVVIGEMQGWECCCCPV